MIPPISSLEITSVVCFVKFEEHTLILIFLCIALSAADATAVNTNSIKKLFASAFVIKEKSVLSNGPRSLPQNCPNCTILGSWVFNNFILADEFFAKTLQSLETSVLVNNLCRK